MVGRSNAVMGMEVSTWPIPKLPSWPMPPGSCGCIMIEGRAVAGALTGALALASWFLSGNAATRMIGGILLVIAPFLSMLWLAGAHRLQVRLTAWLALAAVLRWLQMMSMNRRSALCERRSYLFRC